MREMLGMIESFLWTCRFAVEDKFLRDERGDSNMVAVIVLIVIVIAVAAVFKEQLEGAVKLIFSKLTEFINSNA